MDDSQLKKQQETLIRAFGVIEDSKRIHGYGTAEPPHHQGTTIQDCERAVDKAEERAQVRITEAEDIPLDDRRCIHCDKTYGQHYAGNYCLMYGRGVNVFEADPHQRPAAEEAEVKRQAEAKQQEYIERARELYQTDELEIDDDAKLSDPEDGTGSWVAAWVWVNSEELKSNKKEDKL